MRNSSLAWSRHGVSLMKWAGQETKKGVGQETKKWAGQETKKGAWQERMGKAVKL